jgi:ribonuclease HI
VSFSTSTTHLFKIKIGLGPGTNNYVELMSLKLLLLFAIEKRVESLQIFGDSLIVVNWARNTMKCHNIILFPLLEEVHRLLSSFDVLSITTCLHGEKQ